MLRGRNAAEAVRLALRIVDELDPGASFPPVRIGMHTGPAVERSGDWFGTTVNIAARVSRSARPNEVLLTDETLAHAGRLSGVDVQDRGPCAFRNVLAPVVVHSAMVTRRTPQPDAVGHARFGVHLPSVPAALPAAAEA